MVRNLRQAGPLGCSLLVAVATAALSAPTAQADNKRLNDGVVSNIYTMQHQAGCTNGIRINPQLQLAAQWHTDDVLNNRTLTGDIGSDGSTQQSRAEAAGFRGKVAETVAINPALAINNMDVIRQWYPNPAYHEIMSDCANTQIGVWSENRLDRSVLVAVYGQPENPTEVPDIGSGFDPNPDYDASDELEYGITWLPWILRGVYPPPAYPPN